MTKHRRARDEQDKLFAAAIVRFMKLIGKYPEFDYSDLARQAMATCHSRLGQFTEAIAILLTIPESNRAGELALVPYLLADCYIRTLPPEADDALTAERLIDTADAAAKLLENFLGAQPKSAQAPDALLKLGYCYQRMASQMAVPADRLKTLTKAREAFDRSIQQFPKDPTQPTVIFERARCLALMGDKPALGASGSKFQKTRCMPVAQPCAAGAWFGCRRLDAGDESIVAGGLDVMKRCREEFETALKADPARAGWVPMLQYEYALALQDLHKLPEARAILEEIVKQFPGKPEATNASWRITQCRRPGSIREIDSRRGKSRHAPASPPPTSRRRMPENR